MSLRVLHCPTGVGGHPQALCRIERAAGLSSRSVVFGVSPVGYIADEEVPRSGFRFISSEIRRWTLLKEAIRDYDIIHFNFGTSLMPHPDRLLYLKTNWLKYGFKLIYNIYARAFELSDLPKLKNAGKKIVVTYQGDDARQWDYCLDNFRLTHASEVEPVYRRKIQDEGARKRISEFDRYADIIYALNPDLLHVLPTRAQFFPYAHPNIDEWQFCGVEVNTNRPLRIIHAPSNPLVKGTRFIEEAVAILKQEGLSFEYIKIEGMTNNEARIIYEQADVLVDQLLCGWYGGLSAELMALGKPVVCYIRDQDLHFLPDEMAQNLPIIKADPDTITSVLRRLITAPRNDLAEAGRRCRAFVERWHNPIAIGGRVRSDYEAVMRTHKGP